MTEQGMAYHRWKDEVSDAGMPVVAQLGVKHKYPL